MENGPAGTSGQAWPLVGRAAELDDLDELLSRAADGWGGAVLLEGEAGVGKTRLVEALASSSVLLGIPVERGVAALADRDERPRLVVVEDAHLAQADALDDLRAAAASGPVPGHLAVVTLRPVPHRPELTGVITAWTRAGARWLELRPLSSAAATELAEAIIRASIGPVLRGAVATAGGNPGFVADIVGTARDEGALQAVDGGIDAFGPHWRDIVDERVRERVGYLGPPVLALLARASVLGVSFVVLDLAALAGEPVPAVWRTLRTAIAAGVVKARGDRLVFRHDVVRGALYSGIDPGLRREWHARAAWTLREAGAPQSVVAAHLELAR